MSKSDVFGLVGVCLLALFMAQIWPPFSLLVFGLAFLRAAYAAAPDAPEALDGERP